MNGETNRRIEGSVPVLDGEAAAERIPADGTVLMSGLSGGPKAVPHELADSDRDLALSVSASADAGYVADNELPMAGALAFRYPFVVWPYLRRAVNDGQVAFVDDHLSMVGRRVEQGTVGDPDVAVVEAVAVGEDWLVPTTSMGATPSFVAAADRLIVEVNEALPLSLQHLHDSSRVGSPPRDAIPLDGPADRLGDGVVEFDPGKLAGVVRTEADPVPYPFREPTDAEETIADRVVAFLNAELDRNPVLEDRVAVEIGIGTLGNEITGRLDELALDGREAVYFGEVIQDGLLALLDEGVVSAASATALVLGEDGLERLLDAPASYADDVLLRSMDVSNNPELIRRFGVVAINSAIEADVYGHVNSSHVRGSTLQGGIGGSGDFARNGALSMMVLPSTANGGEVSRIVPMCSHVDHPDHDVDVLVTEQGVADLRGLPPRERAERVVENCAHPAFREELHAYRERAEDGGGHMPHDLSTAFGMHEEG